MRRPKKSKYKSVVIKKKRYYFYKITWLDITGDSGHADLHTASGFMPAEMVTHAYLLNKDRKNVRTFASYEVNDELFSDRNVFPKGCIIKMEKISEKGKRFALNANTIVIVVVNAITVVVTYVTIL